MPPTAKEIKYDRQLRLWSSNGQEALESARLCLINATATGTEILKNLVLPGPTSLSRLFSSVWLTVQESDHLPL
jgi:molybdopterin/thiamine biosynthesis adenylyltransferase